MTTNVSTSATPRRTPPGHRAAKLLIFGQALVVGSYFLLAFIPYFIHGLNREERWDGSHDPKDLFPMKYTTNLLPILDVLLGPFIAGLFALCGLVLLAARWAALPPWMRTALLICAAGTAAFIVVNMVEVGAGVRRWVLD
ncbi:hypothetical protein [Micromonospora sp. NPDC023633]|uniref:hypothetical protein n=1 Tax=Micromonospora sp. NPDC023633 TaxID=3154320 RepID=UPI0033C8EF03